MRLRARIEGDALAVMQFLEDHEYPPRGTWSAEALAECILIRIEEVLPDWTETAGYVWATWSDEYMLCLDFHVCIARPYRTRWFTVLPHLYQIALYLGALAVCTTTDGERASRLVRALLTRRYGYVTMPDGSLFKTLEESDGYFQTEEAEELGADA